MDSFKDAVEHLERYSKTADLGPRETSALGEALIRIRNADKQYPVVRQLNDTMLERDEFISSTRRLMAGLLESQSGARVVNSAELRVHHLDRDTESSPAELEEAQDLLTKTESIYNDLWTAKERLATLRPFKRFNPAGVRDVRNHLMVHTDGKGSGAYIYSVGVATGGPVLRPSKPNGAAAPGDRGLEQNLHEFLASLVSCLQADDPPHVPPT